MNNLKIIYEKDFLENIRKFFELKNDEEFLKSSTWEKIELI